MPLTPHDDLNAVLSSVLEEWREILDGDLADLDARWQPLLGRSATTGRAPSPSRLATGEAEAARAFVADGVRHLQLARLWPRVDVA